MSKRRYTHVKELLAAIKKMVEQGKTQREIAEYYGFKDKMVVKRLLERERRKLRTIPKRRGRKAAKTLTQSYGITPSMSRRGNPFDNAMAEHFFSVLKVECLYRHKPAAFRDANDLIDRYIHFYNHERIQAKTGAPPRSLRHASRPHIPTSGPFCAVRTFWGSS